MAWGIGFGDYVSNYQVGAPNHSFRQPLTGFKGIHHV